MKEIAFEKDIKHDRVMIEMKELLKMSQRNPGSITFKELN